MGFRTAAAELNRKYKQNRNDIEHLYELSKETNKAVGEINTKVDGLATDVSKLKTQVGCLDSKVDGLTIRVDGLTTDVGDRFDRVDERFDRLEQLLTLEPEEHDRSSLPDIPERTEEEQRISLLETKMSLYSQYTRNHIDELRRHSMMADSHEKRFDALDGQMAEVLGILRGRNT